jgi:hypothetical protein
MQNDVERENSCPPCLSSANVSTQYSPNAYMLLGQRAPVHTARTSAVHGSTGGKIDPLEVGIFIELPLSLGN